MQIPSLGGEESLVEGMATHSSVDACRVLWTEEPGGLQPRGHRELDTTEQLAHTVFFGPIRIQNLNIRLLLDFVLFPY